VISIENAHAFAPILESLLAYEECERISRDGRRRSGVHAASVVANGAKRTWLFRFTTTD
jgi:hypothetical protein